MAQIAPTAIIYPDVKLPEDIVIEDFCIVGAPVHGQENLETEIGPGAVLRSHTVIYAGNKIGKNFKTGNKANIRELNTIGDNVSVGTLSVIEHHVTIEDGVRIHTQVFIPEFSTLKKGAWVGPNVVFTNAKYPAEADTKKNLVGPILEPFARIGANSTLLPGVQIGEKSLVGAGSVVTKSVPAGVHVAGNPARVINKIN